MRNNARKDCDPLWQSAHVEAEPARSNLVRIVGQDKSIELIPLYMLHGERFVVEWEVNAVASQLRAVGLSFAYLCGQSGGRILQQPHFGEA
jgi:hypothetical protein